MSAEPLQTSTTLRYLRLKDVEDRTKQGRSTIYRKMSEGKFPRPVELGPNVVRWYEHEIEEWMLSRPRVTYKEAG